MQILQKENGRNKLVKSIGSAVKEAEFVLLESKACQELQLLSKQRGFFFSLTEAAIESFLSGVSNAQIRTIGPELVIGSIYDFIGYGKIEEGLFRHLVIARLAFPLSKLKTIECLYRYQGVMPGWTCVPVFGQTG